MSEVLLLPHAQHFDVDLGVEEQTPGSLQQPDHVVDVSLARRPVVQRQAGRRLVVTHEGGRLHLGVVGAQVVVQVVEAVQEVAQRPTEHAQDVIVSASVGHFEVIEISVYMV